MNKCCCCDDAVEFMFPYYAEPEPMNDSFSLSVSHPIRSEKTPKKTRTRNAQRKCRKSGANAHPKKAIIQGDKCEVKANKMYKPSEGAHSDPHVEPINGLRFKYHGPPTPFSPEEEKSLMYAASYSPLWQKPEYEVISNLSEKSSGWTELKKSNQHSDCLSLHDGESINKRKVTSPEL